MRHLEHGRENIVAELVGYTALEHLPREAVTNAILDDVVQDPSNDRLVVLCITRQDDRNVRGMREVGKASSLPDLLVVMLRRERERVINAIGVARAHGSRLGGGTSIRANR